MDIIDIGFFSIIPPIIAIILALITKEVISSLLIGIISGTIIYSFNTGGGIIESIELLFTCMSSRISQNIFVIIFLALLGALVVAITKAGGSYAYGVLVSSKIKSRHLAQIATALLGILIFIDDYFNCITLGTVMQPVMDKENISRAKFSYIVHSMAPTVCILVPISSWAGSIISYIDSTGLNGLYIFLSTIPLNFYAILTIIMVLIMCFKNFDFGPMALFEKNAREKGDLFMTGDLYEPGNKDTIQISSNGRVWDLIIPILTLVCFSILSMLYQGGFFLEGNTLSQAFSRASASIAITYGAFISLIVAFLLFVPRKLLLFKDFIGCINQGIKSMVPAFIILSLAWTMGAVCEDLLGTGEYIGSIVIMLNIPTMFIPCIVFLLAGILAFAMGTSWGTFGIFIPIVVMICQKVSPEITVLALSAVLAGSVFGDHASPISDTAILSSTSTGCNHIDHVSTQMPYAILVACISFIGYIVMGFTKSLWLSLSLCIIFLVLLIILLHKIYNNKYDKENLIDNVKE